MVSVLIIHMVSDLILLFLGLGYAFTMLYGILTSKIMGDLR